MARKKVADSAAINFRCSAELKAAIEDLARLSRQDVSSLLVELCNEFVGANKTRITNFRRQAAQPLKMPTFAAPTTQNPARSPQITNADEPADNAPLVSAAQDDDKGGAQHD